MTFDQFVAKLVGAESGGNPTAEGAPTKYGTATGKYQVLDSTWNNYKGYKRAKDAPEAIQDEFARNLLSRYVSQFGQAGAAVAWAGGPGMAQEYVQNPTAPKWQTVMVGGDTSIADYVAKTAGGDVATTATGSVEPAHQTLAPNSTPQQIEDYIRANYPDSAQWLDVPSLRQVMLDWASHPDPTEGELVHQIRQSPWWQQNSPQARQYQLLQQQDPAAAQQQFYDTLAQIDRESKKAGANLDPQALFDLAGQAINGGWQADDITRAVAGRLQPGNLGVGNAAANADQIMAKAHSYLVPITRDQAEGLAVQLAAGAADEGTIESWLVAQAKGRFVNEPDVLKAIDKGLTPDQFFSPLRNTIAQTLEIDPNSIDLLDPKYQEVTGFYDDKIKGTRAMTLNEGTQWARDQASRLPADQRPTWWKQQDASLGLNLLNFFGKVAA